MYPIRLNLEGKRCLVVGGGGVALRKIDGLVEEGAHVTVIARAPCAGVEKLAAANEIELHRRPYESGEASKFTLVMAATDDREVNRQVFNDADGAGIWANVADDPPLCSFHLPARVRRGTLQIGIASAGEAPFAVSRLRQVFERKFGEEWAEWMEAAARIRQGVRQLAIPLDEMEERYDQFFSATIDPESLRVRVPSEAEEAAWLSADRSSAEHLLEWVRRLTPSRWTSVWCLSLAVARETRDCSRYGDTSGYWLPTLWSTTGSPRRFFPVTSIPALNCTAWAKRRDIIQFRRGRSIGSS
jgi:siroheme synthase-like protein